MRWQVASGLGDCYVHWALRPLTPAAAPSAGQSLVSISMGGKCLFRSRQRSRPAFIVNATYKLLLHQIEAAVVLEKAIQSYLAVLECIRIFMLKILLKRGRKKNPLFTEWQVLESHGFLNKTKLCERKFIRTLILQHLCSFHSIKLRNYWHMFKIEHHLSWQLNQNVNIMFTHLNWKSDFSF